MGLFRKHYTPAEVGAVLYESLRTAIAASSGDLALASLLARIGGRRESLPDQHAGEIMVGALFAASLAVERSASRWIVEGILSGMRTEFLRHLKEQGALPEQVDEWERILFARSGGFREDLRGYDELEPPWKLGRRFLWAFTGVEDYTALSVKHATLFLLAARDHAQNVLNACGPMIRALPPP
jgi:hypothetical protein